jgi:glycosyltransferase involved in cell wall biosynthesis
MVHSAKRAKTDVPLLSVVMPVYNEIATIHEIILRVLAVDLDKELIIVDDWSTDGTREYLQSLALSEAGEPPASEKRRRLRIFFQDRNYGKGAALRKGFEQAIGQIVVIQDADLELNPQEYGKLIKPIQMNVADIVYGSRFLDKNSEVEATPNYWGNKMLTAASNLFTGLKLTDVWTCYKTFRREILDEIELRENRFAFEPEFTAKVADGSWRITEVPVSYAYRTQKQGKKISWRDGFRGIACTVYYGVICLMFRMRPERVVPGLAMGPVSHGIQIDRSTPPSVRMK